MKILICGYDGYIGWPLTLSLLKQGHRVFGIDDFSRRKRVHEVRSDSLTPILPPRNRYTYLRNIYQDKFNTSPCALGVDAPGYVRSILNVFKPDTIVHLAEMPSAPWSMRDVGHASATQMENVIGTLHLLWAMREECPEAHLVKLGTMGEYGTPECDIPEGEIPRKCIRYSGEISSASFPCPMQDLPFPRSPGSFYHLSKVHDTHNIIFACKTWGLTATDIMQGVVFGVKANGDESDEELTRFDYDQYFGTVINRFCAQAIIGHPLTIYGKGFQKRGFLPLMDSIQCLTIAINNPPKQGKYRTLNQFENVYSIDRLAHTVKDIAEDFELPEIKIDHLENPRAELEDHCYNPIHQKLFDLGYIPSPMEPEIEFLLHDIIKYKERVNKEVIKPTTFWR